jgi:hypothetical protein
MTARTGMVGQQTQKLDRPRPVGPLVFGISPDDGQRWARSHGFAGSPFQRTRRTTVVRDGPRQQSPSTHRSVYVLPDKQVQQGARDVIEAGAYEALHLARTVVFDGHLDQASNPHHHETATADCADDTSSPWSAPDGGCAADFLLCLACPNAHVHHGHCPRLAHLHQQLLSLRSALPDRDWRPIWRDALLRLEDLSRKTSPAVWSTALAQATDNDRTLISFLLEGPLTP